ncbi:glutamate receptor ionotropic, kainate glr-3-like [Eriocheir sinensis]|uniref:glutamate receptor ionotropic, kainate glr-3-like n=1 Tax=Eriocheir sinensis TaxID=95602 RepID=UPI0021C5A5A6|nr:glutamate receptor ionotropic, kainate glr-3-like [Eriocheir sinensis]
MGGRAVRVLAVNHAPSVFSTTDSTGRLGDLSGLDIRVMRALGEALNFTPEFFNPGPDLWGSLLPNGTFSGMVGQVSRGLAEVGVGNVFIAEPRAQHVAFTVPYDFERACFLTPAPSPFPSWMAVTFPFTLHVWLLVLGSAMVMTVMVTALGAAQLRRDRQRWDSLSTAFLFVVATLCNQSRPLPTRPSIQVMWAGLVLGGFVVTVFFASNLTAFLTVTSLHPPFTSIKEITRSGLEVGGYSDFWVPLFRSSANPVIQHLGDNFYRFDDVTEFLKRVIEGRGVLVENTHHLKYLQETFLTDRLGRSSVRLMLEECMNPFGVGAILTKNSPLKSSFDVVIQRLREGGFVDRYFQEEVREQREKASSSLAFAEEAEKEDGVSPLTLNHLQGVFLVWGGGLIGSLLLLLLRITVASVLKGITPTSVTAH